MFRKVLPGIAITTLILGCSSPAQDGGDNSRADTEILSSDTIKQVTYDLEPGGAPDDAIQLLSLQKDGDFHFEVDSPRQASHNGKYRLVKRDGQQLLQLVKATTPSCTLDKADTCADAYIFSFDAAKDRLTLQNAKQAGARQFTMIQSKIPFCQVKDDCNQQDLNGLTCPDFAFRCSHNVCVGTCPQTNRCQRTSDCAADEICRIDPPADACGFDGSTGVCEPRPLFCPAIAGLPVCGCDGTVFVNACIAERAGDPIAQVGTCGGAAGEGKACGGLPGTGCLKGLFCLFTEEQQCGKDDRAGVCSANEGFFCPELKQPVCGCNGETFGNSCFAKVAGQSVAHDGPCARTARGG
jgi:hypothetical protein